jgi:hypothetical protein
MAELLIRVTGRLPAVMFGGAAEPGPRDTCSPVLEQLEDVAVEVLELARPAATSPTLTPRG